MKIGRYLKDIGRAVLNRKTVYSNSKEYFITDMRRFEGKTAVVTGASGAIGSAVAKRLAAEGATVYLGGRNKDKLDALSEAMKVNGGHGIPLVLDITDPDSVEAAAGIVRERSGGPGILVNCAGGSSREHCADIIDQSTEMIDDMLGINLRGTILCTRAFGKDIVHCPGGRIINISSVIGEKGKASFSDYAAAKAGIIGFTRSVAQEFGVQGVTVNCVSPGYIQRGEFREDRLPYLLNSNFLHKIGCAEDVASAVAFLASEESGFITGQNLCVDGGRSLGLHGD